MIELSKKPTLRRLGLAMVMITTLAIVGMLASVYTAEIVRGDAGAINQAGTLRMQSYRILSVIELDQDISSSSASIARAIEAELLEFDYRLTHPDLLEALPTESNHSLHVEYDYLEDRWNNEIKPAFIAYSVMRDLAEDDAEYSTDSATGERSNIRQEYLSLVNDFVVDIDNFVNLLEETSENKIRNLRLTMLVSLALILCAVLFSIFLLTTKVLVPLDRLLVCANGARRGDFSVRTRYTDDDELGHLGAAFNVMSEDLSKMYANLEARVKEKTADLERSNQSLELLYNTIRRLSEAPLSDSTYVDLLREIEKPLGFGPGAICLGQRALNNQMVLASTREAVEDMPDVCFQPNCKGCYADGTTHTFEASTDRRTIQLISTPIKDQERQVGVLFMEVLSEEGVEERQTQMLETVARHVGMALNLTQRVTESRRLALLEERSVIARELHDSLAQSLSYLKIQATRLEMTIARPNKEQEVKAIIGEMREGISSAYRQLRELLTTFRLKMEGSCLNKAVEKTVEDWRERTDINITLVNELNGCQLNAHQEIHLLQVMREVLSNAVNHSKAENIQVQLLYDSSNSRVTICIEDDGVGIAEVTQRNNHYGLAIVNERAAKLGGEIELSRREEKGTRVKLEFSTASRNVVDFQEMLPLETVEEPEAEQESAAASSDVPLKKAQIE